MKINEFIENINGKSEEEFEEMIIARKYIPIQDKKMIVRDVIDRCIDDIDGYITVDSVELQMLFQVAKVKAYTNLEFSSDYEEMINEYDMLCRDGWIDVFDVAVGADVDRLLSVMECEKKSALERNSVEAQIAKVATIIADAINRFDVSKIIPEGIDFNEMLDTLNKLK